MAREFRFDTSKAQLSDLDALCSLEDSIFPPPDRFSRRQLRYLLTSSNAILRFCCAGGSRIGYGISLRSQLRNGVSKGRIYSIGILQGYRAQGAGATLLNAMEADLVRSSVQFITLETKRGRIGAGEFFRRQGYRDVEELPGYYPCGPGVRMRKDTAQKEE